MRRGCMTFLLPVVAAVLVPAGARAQWKTHWTYEGPNGAATSWPPIPNANWRSACWAFRSPTSFVETHRIAIREVEELFQRFGERYERLYYMGLLHERRAKAQMRLGRPPHSLAPLFGEAMRCFAEAEMIRPTGNDDAILRWNRCARLLQSHPGFQEEKESEAFDAFDSSPI
jgi:hypothetical protein